MEHWTIIKREKKLWEAGFVESTMMNIELKFDSCISAQLYWMHTFTTMLVAARQFLTKCDENLPNFTKILTVETITQRSGNSSSSDVLKYKLDIIC